MSDRQARRLRTLERLCLALGGLSFLACAIGLLLDAGTVMQGWLMALFLWSSVPLGALALLMLHMLVGGRWGAVARAPLEAAAATFPLLLLLWAPVCFFLPELYLWARPQVVAGDHLLQHKAPYLNIPFFLIRGLIVFGLWSALGGLMRRWSARQQDWQDGPTHRLQTLSGPGLFLLSLTMGIAAIDWGMSLSPRWTSTMYPLIYMGMALVSAMVLTILVVILLAAEESYRQAALKQPLHDLANLLLAFVILWAYLSYFQYHIVWHGDVVAEIDWYIDRIRGGWDRLVLILALSGLGLPLLLLLPRIVKRRRASLAAVASLVGFSRLVEAAWLVLPTWYPRQIALPWPVFVAPLAVGGLWLGLFFALLRRRPLLPPASRIILARAGG